MKYWLRGILRTVDRNGDGQLHAYEIKWNPVRKVVPSKSFTNAYPSHTFNVIRHGNIEGPDEGE